MFEFEKVLFTVVLLLCVVAAYFIASGQISFGLSNLLK